MFVFLKNNVQKFLNKVKLIRNYQFLIPLHVNMRPDLKGVKLDHDNFANRWTADQQRHINSCPRQTTSAAAIKGLRQISAVIDMTRKVMRIL